MAGVGALIHYLTHLAGLTPLVQLHVGILLHSGGLAAAAGTGQQLHGLQGPGPIRPSSALHVAQDLQVPHERLIRCSIRCHAQPTTATSTQA